MLALGPTGTAVALGCAVLLAALGLRAGVTAAADLHRRALRATRRAVSRLTPRLLRRGLAALGGAAAPLLAQTAPAWASPPPLAPASAPSPVRHPAAGPRAAGGGEVYVVVPGDTLWDIARRHLAPGSGTGDVARAWPTWYEANRSVIGPDPDHLIPGQRLRVPGRRATGTSSASPSAASSAAPSLDPDRR
jgi:nucleoid-associated protein YgaU